MGFLERTREDQALFIYWAGVNDVLPNYSDATIIKRFIKRFGNYCDGCTEEALRNRLIRMRAEYLEEQKTT